MQSNKSIYIMKAHYFIFILILLGCGSCKPRFMPQHNKAQDGKDSLLLSIQKQTFNYFWDAAEPHSGMARERIHLDGHYPEKDADVVTIGGSGFGLLSLLIGLERGFIHAEEGLPRIEKILTYLHQADRFKGAWSHWYYGPSGKVKSFSEKDNGADLVETSFMAQALICVREYFKNGSPEEQKVAGQADQLWKEIEWSFFTNGKQVLYWHWSPTHGWGMNHAIQGYDECMITYILAASSPTFAISKEIYDSGWARNGQIRSAERVYNIPTLLKHNAAPGSVGPLFWAHYSFLALDPRGLTDQYADYGQVVTNHARIHLAHAEKNPKGYTGYGTDQGWGLTASYSLKGYDAHHPHNDHGVISPTAALSSIAYTPEESIAFAQYLTSHLGAKVWGPYGFYDAYSETDNWFPQRYLAIDQGPIVVMIENYRSAFIWKLFMGAPDIQQGLRKLGFSSPYLKK